MLYVKNDSLISPGIHAIVNESNTTGIMRKGVSDFIRLAAGDSVEEESKKICSDNKIKEGDFYITNSGRLENLGIKRIYHAAISKYGILTSIYLISDSMRKILRDANDDKEIDSISFPGLGINIIDSDVVAMYMARIMRNFCGNLDIFVMDFNNNFIEEIKKHLFLK